MFLHLYSFRIAISTGHKHNLHRSTNTEHSLNEPSRSQSFVIWMWRKNHEAGVWREEHVERRQFLFGASAGGKQEDKSEDDTGRSLLIHQM